MTTIWNAKKEILSPNPEHIKRKKEMYSSNPVDDIIKHKIGNVFNQSRRPSN